MNVVDMLNVRYLVVPGRLPEGMFPIAHVNGAQRTVTYENPTALPRATLVGSAITASTDREVYSLLNSSTFNPRTTAIVQGTAPDGHRTSGPRRRRPCDEVRRPPDRP